MTDRRVVFRKQSIIETVEVDGVTSAPSHGLFQPSFPLCEADYLRLQESRPVVAALGGAVLSFALTYGLPRIVAHYQATEAAPSPLSDTDVWITVIALVVGILLLGASRLMSSAKREVKKRIEQHFSDNPGQLEYRA